MPFLSITTKLYNKFATTTLTSTNQIILLKTEILKEIVKPKVKVETSNAYKSLCLNLVSKRRPCHTVSSAIIRVTVLLLVNSVKLA